MNGDATVEVVREGGHRRDSAREYIVRLDGAVAGSIAPFATVTFHLLAGEHSIRVELDGMRSREVRFVAGPGERSQFICRPRGGSWTILLDLAIHKNDYIDIQPALIQRLTINESTEG